MTKPTIRKDLSELHNRRLLTRTHGGAIAVASHLEQTLHDRGEQHREAKQKIAQACREEIARGESVFLDSGTTVQWIAEGLEPLDLNILTNALGVANTVAGRAGLRHTLVGGTVTVRLAVSGDDMSLQVTDTGVGIGPDDIEKLGTPFFTFQDALRRIPYWHNLGITDVYASPFLAARPGSAAPLRQCRRRWKRVFVGISRLGH